MCEENKKFAENNRQLEEQNAKFAESNKQLESSVTDLKEQAEKFKAIYLKLQGENEKLARIRDGLQEQLSVSVVCKLFRSSSCLSVIYQKWMDVSP